jgi:hypothetical protein
VLKETGHCCIGHYLNSPNKPTILKVKTGLACQLYEPNTKPSEHWILPDTAARFALAVKIAVHEYSSVLEKRMNSFPSSC